MNAGKTPTTATSTTATSTLRTATSTTATSTPRTATSTMLQTTASPSVANSNLATRSVKIELKPICLEIPPSSQTQLDTIRDVECELGNLGRHFHLATPENIAAIEGFNRHVRMPIEFFNFVNTVKNHLDRSVNLQDYRLMSAVCNKARQSNLFHPKIGPLMTWEQNDPQDYMLLNEDGGTKLLLKYCDELTKEKGKALDRFKKQFNDYTTLDVIHHTIRHKNTEKFIKNAGDKNRSKLCTAIQNDIKAIATTNNDALYDTAMTLRFLNHLTTKKNILQQVTENISYKMLIQNAAKTKKTTSADHLVYLTEIIDFAHQNTPSNSKDTLAQELAAAFAENDQLASQMLSQVSTPEQAGIAFKQYQALTKSVRACCTNTKPPNLENHSEKIFLLIHLMTDTDEPSNSQKPWDDFYQKEFKDGVTEIYFEHLEKLSIKQMDALLRANDKMVTSSIRLSPFAVDYNKKVTKLIGQLPQFSLEAMSKIDVSKLTDANRKLLEEKLKQCDWLKITQDYCNNHGIKQPTEMLDSPSDVNQFLTKSNLTIPLQVIRFLSKSEDLLKKQPTNGKGGAASDTHIPEEPSASENNTQLGAVGGYPGPFNEPPPPGYSTLSNQHATDPSSPPTYQQTMQTTPTHQFTLPELSASELNRTPDELFNTGFMLYTAALQNGSESKSGLAHITAAAERGNQHAQFTLGILYRNGKDVPQNRETAIGWLTQAAKQNNTDAQFALGNIYYYKDNATLDDLFTANGYLLQAAQDTKHADAEDMRAQQALCESRIDRNLEDK